MHLNTPERTQTDVVIVGSGAVGVTAAIEAREAGARVVVIEREDHLGGAAAISGGGCCMVDTPLQKEKGVEDSVDLAFRDWLRFGEGTADEEWARFYLEHTAHDLYQWAEDRGVQWIAVNKNEGNSVARWHLPKDNGNGLWRALHATALERGADTWLTSTGAKQLIVDQGRITGVLAENAATGQEVEVVAGAVVVGSGGFCSNADMFYEYAPQLRPHRVLEGSHIGATGDGHKMVEGAGGVLTHMDELWFYVFSIPDHLDPRDRRGLVIRGIPNAVWINPQGRRFHDEYLSGGATGAPAVFAQDPAECWAVVDATMHAAVSVGDPRYTLPGSSARDADKVNALIEESPDIKAGDTLEGLAGAIGVPADTFVESVSRFNGFIDDAMERCPDFGRSLEGLRRLETPPYRAFHFMPLARKNFGGVKTDLRCRALDKHYEPIPGLYAAGELTGMAGGHINGHNGLEGTMLGPALFSGRVAGAWATHAAGFGDGFTGTPKRG